MLTKLTERHPELKGASAGDYLLRWLPLVIACVTAIWTFAVQSKQVEQNRLDIVELRASGTQSTYVLHSVDTRLARIETTLNIITGNDGKAQFNGRRP